MWLSCTAHGANSWPASLFCRSADNAEVHRGQSPGPVELSPSGQASHRPSGLFEALKLENPGVSVEEVLKTDYRGHQQQFFSDRNEQGLLQRMERRMAGKKPPMLKDVNA